jgi:hypothetical protein
MTLSFSVTTLAPLNASASQAAQTKPPQFSVAISPVPAIVRAGSEIRVKIVMTNTTDHEINIVRSPGEDNGENWNDIEGFDETGKAASETEYYRAFKGKGLYKGHIVLRMGSNILFPVKPGEALKDGIIVGNLFDLSKPGKYTVHVQRPDRISGNIIKSNTITITVTP